MVYGMGPKDTAAAVEAIKSNIPDGWTVERFADGFSVWQRPPERMVGNMKRRADGRMRSDSSGRVRTDGADGRASRPWPVWGEGGEALPTRCGRAAVIRPIRPTGRTDFS